MANGILSLTILLVKYNSCFSSVKGDCTGGETAVWSNNDLEEWPILLQNDTEYCYENECTIRIMESNVLLNIINITEDWIVATNDTNLFTVPVTNNNSVNHCSLEDDPIANHFIIFAIISFAAIILSLLNIALHLAIKELRSIPGFIIFGICGTIIIMYITIIITAVFQYLHRVNGNTAICAVFKYMIIYFMTIYIMLKTTYLFYFTYLMYQTYKSRPYPEMNKKFLYIYGVVIVTASIICIVLIIVADQLRYKKAFDTYNGYCIGYFFNKNGTSDYIFQYIIVIVLFAILTAVGMVFLITGLALYYLTTKRFCTCGEITAPNDIRVSITLISATALGTFILIILLLAGFQGDGSVMAGSIGTCIEQIILLIVFLTSRKTQEKLKRYTFKQRKILPAINALRGFPNRTDTQLTIEL